tara:strand:+ start:389 stop:589 length:201 start_codon:yes stop_codon:yes gene_type:complete
LSLVSGDLVFRLTFPPLLPAIHLLKMLVDGRPIRPEPFYLRGSGFRLPVIDMLKSIDDPIYGIRGE